MMSLIAKRLTEMMTDPERYGTRVLNFFQLSSLLWSYRLLFTEYKQDYKVFEELIAEYF